MNMINWLWKPSSKIQQQNEEDLKKKGFDPEQLEIQEIKQEPITDFSKDYQGFISPTPQQIANLIESYKFFPNDEEPRHQLGYSKGGKICGDQKQVSKIRSIGKQMIKLLGKKLISGQFNLTKVSFPIKAMVPKTGLQSCTLGSSMFPIFTVKAAQCKDPVQKMKFFVTAIVSSFYYMNLFLKPLNPILGQTLQGTYSDGTQLYCEQISHHPPISYFLVIGPNNLYRYSGYYQFEAKAGLNSMTVIVDLIQLVNKGLRKIQFKTGQVIKLNFAKEIFSGVFLGTLRTQTIGDIEFCDEKNNIKCTINFGKTKKKPSDYFTGKITKNNKNISQIQGSYCGFINIDGVRYWDGRYMKAFKINLDQNTLESDFRNRSDLQRLKQGKISQAQTQKQRLEQFQRRDAKLRHHK